MIEKSESGCVVVKAENPAAASQQMVRNGLEFAKARDPEKAQAWYWSAIAVDPTCAEAWHQLGVLALNDGQNTCAVALMRRSVDLKPDDAPYWCNYGLACAGDNRAAEAEAAYRRSLSIDPAHPQTLNNLGAMLQGDGRYAESEKMMLAALSLDPGFVSANVNLCRLYLQFDETERATRHAESAVAAEPGRPEAAWNLALCRLRSGELSDGWNLYEARFHLKQFVGKCVQLPTRRWNGEPLDGKRLLLMSEQGLGDTIQFIRCAAACKAMGATTLVNVQPELRRIAQRVEGIDEVHAYGDPVPEHDFWCPMLSVPRLIGINSIDAIPRATQYIASKTSPSRGVGICWRGSAGHANDRERSIRIEDLAPLAETGCEWVNLQYGQQPPAWVQSNPMPMVTDLADTAEIIAGLSLVVTVDTAIAHLAGALGVRTLLLLPLSSDWRWFRGRDDSPWYPSVRLIRQRRGEPWSEVVKRVAAMLAEAKAAAA